LLKIQVLSWASVAHACNPSYSGGRDQENHAKPVQAKFVRPYLKKKPFTKKGLVEWLKVKALSSNPSTTHKKKNYSFSSGQAAADAGNIMGPGLRISVFPSIVGSGPPKFVKVW
jgi:hypothetical protein